MESIPKSLGGTFDEFNEPYTFNISETGPFFCPPELVIHKEVKSPLPSVSSSSSYDSVSMGKLFSPSCSSEIASEAPTPFTTTSKITEDDLGSVRHDISDSIASIKVEKNNQGPSIHQSSTTGTTTTAYERRTGALFTPNRGEIESELLDLRDVRKGYSTKFEDFVPQDDWLDGRWVQTGNSVYGVIIGHLLLNMEFDLELLRKGYVFFLQQAILIGFLHGYIVNALWIALPPLNSCLLSSTLWPLVQVGLIFFLLSMVPSLMEIYNELHIVATAR